MSILKSTNSGRCAIPLTITYLINNHWYWQAPSHYADIDYNKIWKNQKDYLNLIYDKNRNVTSIYLEWSSGNFIYTLVVKTLADLDLVERFWQLLRKDKGNAPKLLKQNAKNLKITSLKPEPFDNIIADYTKVVDQRILANLENMDKVSYTDNNLKDFWKPQKYYFSSYFK